MIIDMNRLSNLMAKLNKEFFYKLGETKALAGEAADYDFLIYVTNGEHVTIKFMGVEIWNSQTVQNLEQMPVERQIAFNESDEFEKHIRQLIQDELNALERVVMV